MDMQWCTCSAIIDAITKERDRYREALEKIAADCEWPPKEAAKCVVDEHQRARAALAEAEKGSSE